ncbi:MAG TPA: GNAT family N-acetyltransferase [Acidimicrobiia bacterium]|nr:GNAT family N-acetyltransferase [Acidimicrobiia bacterium]
MAELDSFLTADADQTLLDELHALCVCAFDGDFDLEDWEHSLGGRHFVTYEAGMPRAHASVVPRTLEIEGRPLQVGYVEAVATDPDHQGRGFGTMAMEGAGRWIRASYQMGVLATGEFHFYERLGWERWTGLTYVRDGVTQARSEDADGAIMVLRFGPSERIGLDAAISCEARSGDDW